MLAGPENFKPPENLKLAGEAGKIFLSSGPGGNRRRSGVGLAPRRGGAAMDFSREGEVVLREPPRLPAGVFIGPPLSAPLRSKRTHGLPKGVFQFPPGETTLTLPSGGPKTRSCEPFPPQGLFKPRRTLPAGGLFPDICC